MLDSPRIIEKAGRPTEFLQFAVTWCKPDGTKLMKSKGWRIGNGELNLPSAPLGRRYVETAEVGRKFKKTLVVALRQWVEAFPSINFPQENQYDDD